MKKFKTKIEGYEEEFEFLCYENTEPIEMGDLYIFFLAGMADVLKCETESEKEEINQNGKTYKGIGDLVTGFWKNCYKIKETDFIYKSGENNGHR
jgi:hypothetical protein